MFAMLGPMWTSISFLTFAACAICAAPVVPHCPNASPSWSMISWSSQHMHSMTSALRASSVTESHGWVSPVKTMDFPPLVSSRYAREVEVWLDVFGWSGCGLPHLSAVLTVPGSDVAGVNDGWFAWQGAASVYVDALAQGMADACDPVVCEDAFFFVEDAVV